MSTRKTLKKLRRDAKGISPLIATLLLIAIAVAASVITYSWVMSMISGQSQQAQTQVRIDNVSWNLTGNSMDITVRNTGSVSATIESIAVRVSPAGSTFYPEQYTTANSIPTGQTLTFTWNEADPTLAASTSYVIRVTTSTGFYYEMTATSPSS